MAAKQVHSGDRSTNFTMACNLLSQYIKENSFVPRPIEPIQGRLENVHVPVTMNLFPGVDTSDESNEREMNVVGSRVNELELFPRQPTMTHGIREEESSQLTIMYGGKVLVFDNFSAEKADILIDMVNKASPNAQNFATPALLPEPNKVPVMKSTLAAKCISSQPIFPDLPLSRKASLQRFFEKRKDRIHANGPYSHSKASPAKSEEESASLWLGLVPPVSTNYSFSQASDSSK